MTTREQMEKLLTDHPDMTYRRIGEMVGVTKQRVYQVALKNGLTKSSRRHRPDITVEKVVNLYRHTDLFVRDIARTLGCHPVTVTTRLRAAGISKRMCNSRKQKLLAVKSDGMLTLREVSRMLTVHISTVRRWNNQGLLKSYRIGPRRDRRFTREDIVRFLKGEESASVKD